MSKNRSERAEFDPLKEKKLLQELDQHSYIHNQDKVMLLLLLCDEKPSANIELYYSPGYEEDFEEDQQQDEAMVIELLKKLQLEFVVSRISDEADDEYPALERSVFYISKQKKLAEELQKAFADLSFFETSAGHLLGYPKTAVEAFPLNSVIEEELPDEVLKSDEFKFLFFRLSRAHWKEEFEWLKEKVIPLIKKYLPETYKLILRTEKH